MSFTYPNGKKKILTQVKKEYLQFIFYLTIDDEHNIQNIMYIPPQIFKYLQKTVIIECNKLLKQKNNEKMDIGNEKMDIGNEKMDIENEKFKIENINPEYAKYIYDIIKYNT